MQPGFRFPGSKVKGPEVQAMSVLESNLSIARRCSRILRSFTAAAVFCLAVAVTLPLATPAFASSAEKQLTKNYKTWLQKEVNYIITRTEKNEFLQLKTDDERDKFIERFWDLRNPNPGAPDNPYKTEHYKRLEYANDHFSNNDSHDGWNTDMGRIWITLGQPQQKARYVTQAEVRGMEIWFYSQGHPALPPNFYVVFYEKDFGDFRLYSPYIDGPQKLISSHYMENGRVAAVKQIDKILGREVARTTLSLIPGEPVNLNDAVSTLQSDLMLGTIKDLANNPFSLEELNLRKSMKESVSHRVVMPGESLNVLTMPLRDRQGIPRLNYVLRLDNVSDFAVAKADEKYYISIEVTTQVFTPEHKLIFQQDRKIAHYLTKDELEEVKGKPFGYEGWLPLAPGKYHVEFSMLNLLGRAFFTAEREVVMPSPPTEGFTVTEVVPFVDAKQVDPASSAVLPFSSGGVKFTPYTGKNLVFAPGEDLKVFYQIWSAPTAPQNRVGKKLLADYAYGRPGISGTAKQIHDEALKEQFDENGSMISGKKLETTDLDPGNYRMALTVSDPETREKRFGTISFVISPTDPSPKEAWDVYDDKLVEYVSKGQSDYEFGLSCLAQNDKVDAERAWLVALQKNPQHEMARTKLVDFYLTQQAYGKITQLYSKAPVTAKTDDQTVIGISDSFDKTGNTRKAADVVESAITLKPESGHLYLALASYYQRLGNAQKAQELERKGKSLIAASSPSE